MKLLAVLLCTATLLVGCNGSGSVLSQEVAARRLAADVRVQFTKASDASNRAVMADTDEASVAGAQEAKAATAATVESASSLTSVLRELGRTDEVALIEAFDKKFAEYRTLDKDILGLAVENTNLKAQRLSFGTGAEAADSFRHALDAVAQAAPSADVDALTAKAALAVKEIQVLQLRHIAEADEAAMTKMEGDMTAAERSARQDLTALSAKMPATSRSALADSQAALDRFLSVQAEILALSRRNSNVRSLALSLGRKRTVTAECDDVLQMLQDAIAKHEFRATR